MYNLLFRFSAAATQHLAKDARFVGGQIGLVGFLHTWGRNLSYHPHIHYLIPASGLAANAQTLRSLGQAWLPARQDFLLPAKALSKIFHGKFRQALQKTALFRQVPAKVWQQAWVVHCKPVGNGRTALKYLVPYVFRVAISNRRLVSLENGRVTFRYRTTDTGQLKLCTLSTEEFIHRFLHAVFLTALVLPKGFVKVRYFGFFSPGCRKRLAALHQLLVQKYPENLQESETTPESNTPTSEAKLCCPSCGQPLLLQRMIQPTGRCPPCASFTFRKCLLSIWVLVLIPATLVSHALNQEMTTLLPIFVPTHLQNYAVSMYNYSR